MGSKQQVMVHRDDGDGKHAVAAALRVLISPTEEGGYVAQGLEIDYVATGPTVESVQQRFALGLLRTAEALLRRHRDLSAMFKSRTPPEVWKSYMESERQDKLTCAAFIDFSDKLPSGAGFPFQQLAFCEASERARA